MYMYIYHIVILVYYYTNIIKDSFITSTLNISITNQLLNMRLVALESACPRVLYGIIS